MSKENQKTLEVYEGCYQEFLANAKRRQESRGEQVTKGKKKREYDFWNRGFSCLPRPTRILEVGAGNGMDAKALIQMGFLVTPSEATEGFLDEISKNGLKPLKYNVLTDRLDRRYDGVLARNVFVHFTKEDAKEALKNIFEILRPGGRLIFNVQNVF